MFSLGSQIVGVETDHPDNAGLAAWFVGLSPWDGGGTLYDLTGNTKGATLAGGAVWTGTPYGQHGLSFGGSPQRADVPYSPGYDTPALSAACWIRTTMTGGGNFLDRDPENGTRPWQFLVSGGKLSVIPVTGGVTVLNGAATVNDGVWHRVGFSYSASGAMALYVDGRPDGTGSSGHALATAPGVGVTLGANGSAGVGFFAYYAGLLADVGLYGLAASADWFARDFAWSRDPQTDPRIRRASTRSLFVTAGGVPTTSYLPGLVCGYGM